MFSLLFQKRCLLFRLICLKMVTCITLFSSFNFLSYFCSQAQRHSFLVFSQYHFLFNSSLVLGKIGLFLVNFHLIVEFHEIVWFVQYQKLLCFFTYEFLVQKIIELINIQNFTCFCLLVLLLQASLDQRCYQTNFDFRRVIEFKGLNFMIKNICCSILTNSLKLLLISPKLQPTHVDQIETYVNDLITYSF